MEWEPAGVVSRLCRRSRSVRRYAHPRAAKAGPSRAWTAADCAVARRPRRAPAGCYDEVPGSPRALRDGDLHLASSQTAQSDLLSGQSGSSLVVIGHSIRQTLYPANPIWADLAVFLGSAPQRGAAVRRFRIVRPEEWRKGSARFGPFVDQRRPARREEQHAQNDHRRKPSALVHRPERVSVIRVGSVAQTVTEEIEGKDGYDHAADWKHQPRVKRYDIDILSFVEQHAPTRHRRSQSKAEEG